MIIKEYAQNCGFVKEILKGCEVGFSWLEAQIENLKRDINYKTCDEAELIKFERDLNILSDFSLPAAQRRIDIKLRAEIPQLTTSERIKSIVYDIAGVPCNIYYTGGKVMIYFPNADIPPRFDVLKSTILQLMPAHLTVLFNDATTTFRTYINNTVESFANTSIKNVNTVEPSGLGAAEVETDG